MPAFTADRDDEERMKTYILQRVPPELKRELDGYLGYRMATFAAKRQGGAVQVWALRRGNPRDPATHRF